jgi:hypothetical protein
MDSVRKANIPSIRSLYLRNQLRSVPECETDPTELLRRRNTRAAPYLPRRRVQTCRTARQARCHSSGAVSRAYPATIPVMYSAVRERGEGSLEGIVGMVVYLKAVGVWIICA